MIRQGFQSDWRVKSGSGISTILFHQRCNVMRVNPASHNDPTIGKGSIGGQMICAQKSFRGRCLNDLLGSQMTACQTTQHFLDLTITKIAGGFFGDKYSIQAVEALDAPALLCVHLACLRPRTAQPISAAIMPATTAMIQLVAPTPVVRTLAKTMVPTTPADAPPTMAKGKERMNNPDKRPPRPGMPISLANNTAKNTSICSSMPCGALFHLLLFVPQVNAERVE